MSKLLRMVTDWWARRRNVRCDHWKTCGATNDQCNHRGKHKLDTTKETLCASGFCMGGDGKTPMQVRCIPVERRSR